METFCPMMMRDRVQKVLTINRSKIGMRVVCWHWAGVLSAPMGKIDMPLQHNHRGKLVLVVQEDGDLRGLLCDMVRELELEVSEATNGNGAIQSIRDLQPQLVLTDLRIHGGGFDYVRAIRTLSPSCPIILLAEIGDHHAKAEALTCGVKAFFVKPARFADLKRAIIGLLDGE